MPDQLTEPTRLIIDNRTGSSTEALLPYIGVVLNHGRVSDGPNGPQYCGATTWPDGIVVVASRNKGSDRLVIYYEPDRDTRQNATTATRKG